MFYAMNIAIKNVGWRKEAEKIMILIGYGYDQPKQPVNMKKEDILPLLKANKIQLYGLHPESAQKVEIIPACKVFRDQVKYFVDNLNQGGMLYDEDAEGMSLANKIGRIVTYKIKMMRVYEKILEDLRRGERLENIRKQHKNEFEQIESELRRERSTVDSDRQSYEDMRVANPFDAVIDELKEKGMTESDLKSVQETSSFNKAYLWYVHPHDKACEENLPKTQVKGYVLMSERELNILVGFLVMTDAKLQETLAPETFRAIWLQTLQTLLSENLQETLQRPDNPLDDIFIRYDLVTLEKKRLSLPLRSCLLNYSPNQLNELLQNVRFRMAWKKHIENKYQELSDINRNQMRIKDSKTGQERVVSYKYSWRDLYSNQIYYWIPIEKLP